MAKRKQSTKGVKNHYITIKGKRTYLNDEDYKHWTDVKNLYCGYYDRQGKRISLLGWVKLIEENPNGDYKRVDETYHFLGLIRISTVWLGLDYGFAMNKNHMPIIFETMVFAKCCGFRELDMDRYSTEDEAYQGHAHMDYEWGKLQHLVGHIWHIHIVEAISNAFQKLKKALKGEA